MGMESGLAGNPPESSAALALLSQLWITHTLPEDNAYATNSSRGMRSTEEEGGSSNQTMHLARNLPLGCCFFLWLHALDPELQVNVETKQKTFPYPQKQHTPIQEPWKAV